MDSRAAGMTAATNVSTPAMRKGRPCERQLGGRTLARGLMRSVPSLPPHLMW